MKAREEQGGERVRGGKEGQRGPTVKLQTCACVINKEKEREEACVRVCVVEVEKSSSIYMMAVCLGRLLMGRKRVVVIKGTRDSIQWHTERPSRLSKLSCITEDTDVFLISSFLAPPYPFFRLLRAFALSLVSLSL